eukprot:8552706-Lingulodinium_polyedra.AAC.1
MQNSRPSSPRRSASPLILSLLKKKRWRLTSQMSRTTSSVSLEELGPRSNLKPPRGSGHIVRHTCVD